MNLIHCQLSALRFSFEFWEVVEFSGLVVVLLGVIGEYIAEFTALLPDEQTKKRVGKLSTLVLIVGLVFEFLGSIRTTQLSRKEISSLNYETAVARQKQVEAELAVQRLKTIASPRWIDEESFLEALKGHSKPAGVFVSFVEDNEAQRLSFQLAGVLFQAGWHVYVPAPITRAHNAPAYLSSAESLGGSSSGLTIVARGQEGWHPPPFDHNTPYDALWNATEKALNRPFILHGGRDDTLPHNTMRIIVGSKESPVVP
jgi:hypothetical protein